MTWFIQGWLLGIAYVAPIGMQNMYVINTAVQKSRTRAIQVALITIFFDITLALACFFGIGYILEKLVMLRLIILGIGSIAVMVIGIMLLRSKPDEGKELDLDKPILEVVATCFAVTWLNPQAIIDGSLLLGGFKATLVGGASMLFILGVSIASFMWFIGISTLVSIFKNWFTIKIIRYINIACGSIILLFGLKLGYMFIKSI